MFGHHKARKQMQKKRTQKPPKVDEAEAQKSQIAKRTAELKDITNKGREEGVSYAEQILNKEVAGLDPKKRQAMQYEANKGIQRSVQATNRKLLGDQASRGIVGKGGVGYAQQREVNRIGTEAQSAAARDLEKLDADLAIKKKAAMFAGGEGHATQAQLNNQQALDEINLEQEKKKQKKYEDKHNRSFSRV